MKNAFVLAVLAVSFTTGCMDFRDFWSRGYEPEPYDPGYYYGDDYRDVVVSDGVVEGAMGDYDGFVAPAYEQTGYTTGTDANVTLHAGTGYWVMTGVTVTGGLDHPDLVPGTIHTFNDETRAAAYSSTYGETLSVDVLGCSGPTQGNYTYDSHANEVVVQVEDGLYENERVFYFTARFDNYGTVQTTTGSFTYDTVAR
jgi:hypothetical protein